MANEEVVLKLKVDGFDDIVSGGKTAKNELKELKLELQRLEIAGERNSKKFQELAARAGQLQDSIGDVNATIKRLASDTARVDKVVGAFKSLTSVFTAAQGAAAVFGDENEDLQKTIAKTQGALALLNGVQQIQADLRDKDTAAYKVLTVVQGAYNKVVGQSTGVLKGLKVALAATGIGLFAVALGVLIENFDSIKTAVLNLFPGLNKLSTIWDSIKAGFEGFKAVIVFGFKNISSILEAFFNQLFILPRAIAKLITDGPQAAIDLVKQTFAETKNVFDGALDAAKKGVEQGKKNNEQLKKIEETKKKISEYDDKISKAEADRKDSSALRIEQLRLEQSLLEKGSKDFNDLQIKINKIEDERSKKNKTPDKKEEPKKIEEVATAYEKLQKAVEEARKKLEGFEDPLSPNALKAAEDLNKATIALENYENKIQEVQDIVSGAKFIPDIDKTIDEVSSKYEELDRNIKEQFVNGQITSQEELNQKLRENNDKRIADTISALEKQRLEVENSDKITEKAKIDLITKTNEEIRKLEQERLDNSVKLKEKELSEEEKAAEEKKKIYDDVSKYIQDLEDKQNQSTFRGRLEFLEKERDARIEQAKKAGLETVAIESEYNEKIKEERRALAENVIGNFQSQISGVGNLINSIGAQRQDRLKTETNEEINELNRRFEAGIINEQQLEESKTKIKEKAAEEEKKIRKRIFKADKAIKIVESITGTALAVVSALRAGPIAGPILAGVIGTLGAAQTAVIARSKFPEGEEASSSGSNPVASISTPTFNPVEPTGAALQVGNQNLQREQRVYVLESDISRTQNRVEVLESRNRFGG